MEASPLARLSGELRNTIYQMVLTHERGLIIGKNPVLRDNVVRTHLDNSTNLRTALGFTQACRGLRAEARFLEVNNILLTGLDLFVSNEQCLPDPAPWLQKIRNIPQHLLSNKTKFVMDTFWQLDYMLRQESLERGLAWFKFALPVTQLLSSIKPHPLSIDVRVGTHKWARSQRLAGGSSRIGVTGTVLCKKGTPLSCNDCGTITYQITFQDANKVKEEARRLMESTAEKVKTHAEHRGCPIRLEGRAMLEGLAASYRFIEVVIDHVMAALAEGTTVDGGAVNAQAPGESA